MEYSIQTKKYEGPMELLLDLIKRNKIDISDISIVEITEQYVDYVDNMDEMDLDFASDFIDMAARLLEIKSRYILYLNISIVEITEQYVDYVDNMDEMDLDFASDFIDMAARLLEIKSRYILYLKYNSEDEEDPRKELVQKIEEYKKFREITDSLRDNIKEYDDRFYREKEEYLDEDDELDLSDITIDEIAKIALKIFRTIDDNEKSEEFLDKNEKLKSIVRQKNISVKEEYLDENDELDLSDITIDEIAKIALKIFRTIDDNEKSEEFLDKNEKLKSIVRQKNISVESRIDSIREKIKIESKVKFSDILESKEKREVIASFLAILELIKMKEIVIRQEGVYQDIIIRKKDENEDIIINDKADKEYEKLEKKASRRMERKFKSQQ